MKTAGLVSAPSSVQPWTKRSIGSPPTRRSFGVCEVKYGARSSVGFHTPCTFAKLATMSSSWPSTDDSIRDDGNRDSDSRRLEKACWPDAINQNMDTSVEQRVLGFLQRVGAMARPE